MYDVLEQHVPRQGIAGEALLAAVATSEHAVAGAVDDLGSRFLIDFTMSGRSGEAVVRSAWIVGRGEDFPRFVTCYVL